MRTTLEIDDTVLAAARSLAQSSGTSLGAAVSELARRGLSAGPRTKTRVARVDTSYSPFPIVIGDGEQLITDELVAAHRDD